MSTAQYAFFKLLHLFAFAPPTNVFKSKFDLHQNCPRVAAIVGSVAKAGERVHAIVRDCNRVDVVWKAWPVSKEDGTVIFADVRL